MKIIQRKSDNERGIALLMTLAILSILTVVVLSFATTALQSQSMAKIGEHNVKARLLVESGFQSVYETISMEVVDPNDRRNLFPETKLGIVGHFGPTTQSTAWNGRSYWASMGDDTAGIREALHAQIAGVDYTPDSSHPMLHDTVGWIHELDGGGSGAIVGRYAYVVVDESGKIDPSAAIHASIAEGQESGSRIGLTTSDLNLNPVVGDSFADLFQYEGVGSGLLDDNMRWLSYHYIFRQHDMAMEEPDTILQERVFPHAYDIEAFHNGVTDKHRFDIINVNWDSFDNVVANSGLDADASDFWKGETYETNEGGIPWLHYCTDNTLKHQIMANLIDYGDSDNIATTDSALNPTYVGNEEVPYINEFLFQAQIYFDTDSNSWMFRLKAWPEFINMYEKDLGDDGQLAVTVEVESVDLPSNPSTVTFNWNGQSDVAQESYDRWSEASLDIALGATQDELRNLKLTVTSALYKDASGQLWDAARTEKSPATYLDAVQSRWISVECDDPRNNLDVDEWTWPDASEGWSNGLTGTIDPPARNSVCNPNPAPGSLADTENGAVEPWDISTAYIRNAPLQTIWELGAIHRGDSWQTINLCAFNEGVTDTTGLGDYIDGDANILDQIKMDTGVTPLANGKVNINTRHNLVLRGLLNGLSYGDSYAMPTGSGTTLSNSQIDQIVGSYPYEPGHWFFENGTAGVIRPFFNRGAVARCQHLTNGTVISQDNDMAREELIGKFINITTVRSNYFVAIVTAQSIKDLPTGIKGGTKGVFDVDVDIILAEQKLMVTFYRDAFRNRFDVVRYEYIVN